MKTFTERHDDAQFLRVIAAALAQDKGDTWHTRRLHEIAARIETDHYPHAPDVLTLRSNQP
jgi:hypothetical protein